MAAKAPAAKKVAKKATKATKKVVKKAAPKKKTWEEMDADELRAFVIEKAMAYPGGCESGKHDFVENHLGAKLPKYKLTFTVELETSSPAAAKADAKFLDSAVYFDSVYHSPTGRYDDLLSDDGDYKISDVKVETV